MQVTTEQLDPCKIALTISVEPEKVAAARDKAFNQFARNLQLPGFRKGKVPAHLAKSYVDQDRVKQRAAEILVQPAYEEALAETKIEPFDRPDLELVEMNDEGPFVFKALVPLTPVVTLGPYKGIDIERARLEVNDADVDRQLEELRTRSADFEDVEGRPAQLGDSAFAELAIDIEGQEPQEPGPTMIEIGKNIPEFDNGLVGMEIGETKTIEIVYPGDFHEASMRGKRGTFTVTIKGLRVRHLPELNDEFAQEQKAYPDAKTLDALRDEIRAGLEKAAQTMADNDFDMNLVNRIVGTSQINYPEVLLRQEMEHDASALQQRLERDKISIEEYLEHVGKTQEQVEHEMAATADRRIRTSLVLSEIARTEDLAIDEADVQAEIDRRAENSRVSAAALRAFYEKSEGLGAVRNQAQTKKVLDFLKAASHITEKVITDADLRAAAEAENQANAETGEAAGSAEAAGPLPIEQTVPGRRSEEPAATEA